MSQSSMKEICQKIKEEYISKGETSKLGILDTIEPALTELAKSVDTNSQEQNDKNALYLGLLAMKVFMMGSLLSPLPTGITERINVMKESHENIPVTTFNILRIFLRRLLLEYESQEPCIGAMQDDQGITLSWPNMICLLRNNGTFHIVNGDDYTDIHEAAKNIAVLLG